MLGLQEQLEEQEEALKKQSADLKQTNLSLQQEQLRSSEVKLHLEQSEQEQKRENEHLSLLLDDRSEVTQAYMDSRDKLKELRETVAAREGQDTEAKALLEKLQKEIAKYGSAITALDNQLQDAKIALETANAKAELISGNMHNLDNDTLRLRGEIDANQKEQERLTQLIADCERQKEALAQENSAALTKLAETLGGKDEFAGQRGELLDKQAGVEQELSNLRRKSGAGENRLREAELALARHSSGCEHLEQQLTDEFQMDEQEARERDLAKWQEYALKELQGMESSLTLKIAALGPINAAAIEEYEAVKERSEFLRKQYDDLCTAKENLEAVIGEINSGMTKRFKEAFAQINEYFHQCYVKLFGGGTAVLRLTEPVREGLRRGGLTERHARALLRLPDEAAQLAALSVITARGMNVAQTESYVETLLTEKPVPQRSATYIIKDVRLFLNSIDRSLQMMRQSGVDADLGRRDTDSEIFLTIRIPKGRPARA